MAPFNRKPLDSMLFQLIKHKYTESVYVEILRQIPVLEARTKRREKESCTSFFFFLKNLINKDNDLLQI